MMHRVMDKLAILYYQESIIQYLQMDWLMILMVISILYISIIPTYTLCCHIHYKDHGKRSMNMSLIYMEPTECYKLCQKYQVLNG